MVSRGSQIAQNVAFMAHGPANWQFHTTHPVLMLVVASGMLFSENIAVGGAKARV